MKKLLVIEDDNIVNQAYKEKLGSFYEMAFALEGQSGLTKATSWLPGLIILDILLPGGIDGFDVLRELKKNPKTKEIDVVVLTNLAQQEKRALAEGALECLVKANTSLDKVVSTVKKYLPPS